jgi:hypothetical protein
MEKIIVCEMCLYQTTSRSAYKNHLETRKHNLLSKGLPLRKIYKCDTCDYKTQDKSNYNKHLLKHSNICKSCNIKFNDKKEMVKHSMTKQHYENVNKNNMNHQIGFKINEIVNNTIMKQEQLKKEKPTNFFQAIEETKRNEHNKKLAEEIFMKK